MTFEEAYRYLLELPSFAHQGEAAYRPGLDRIKAILEQMGRPHQAFKSVHVAGTNGKGSTASMIAAILQAYGCHTGLHTSPHLMEVTERMRVNGAPASKEWLAEAVAKWQPVFEQHRPSFFEATVALSFLYFASQNVDWAVVEVGMGGRLDATNVLRSEAAVITQVGLDHTQWLGDTLPEIAREKAGIITPGVPVCVGDDNPAVANVVRKIARARKAPFHWLPQEVTVEPVEGGPQKAVNVNTPEHSYSQLQIGLPGRHQRANALLALRVAELLLPPGNKRTQAISAGIANVTQLVGLHGRLEQLQQEPPILVDVAHNRDSLVATLNTVQREYQGKAGRLIVVFGVMADKDVAAMADGIRAANACVWPVGLPSTRAMDRSVLEAQLKAANVELIGTGGDIPTAVRWFRKHSKSGDVLLATGSHLVVSAVLQEIRL